MAVSKVKIIQSLTLLDLPLDKVYNAEDVNKKYLALSKIYHPDVSRTEYKDGEKFKQITEAKDYLIENYKEINMLLLNGLENESSVVNDYVMDNQSNVKVDVNAHKTPSFSINKKLAIGLVLLWIIQVGLFFAFAVNYGSHFNEGDSYYPTSIVLLILSLSVTVVNVGIIEFIVLKEKWNTLFILVVIVAITLLIVYVIKLYQSGYYKPFSHYEPYYVYDTSYFAIVIAAFAVESLAEIVTIIVIHKFNHYSLEAK